MYPIATKSYYNNSNSCEHNYQIAKENYYKPTGEKGALGIMTYKQDISYSMLFCTKCGETKEIVSNRKVK